MSTLGLCHRADIFTYVEISNSYVVNHPYNNEIMNSKQVVSYIYVINSKLRRPSMVNKLSSADLVSEDKKYSTAVLPPTGLNVDMMLNGGSPHDGNGLQRSATEQHNMLSMLHTTLAARTVHLNRSNAKSQLHLYTRLVGWSLTSLFSTNTAISETTFMYNITLQQQKQPA